MEGGEVVAESGMGIGAQTRSGVCRTCRPYTHYFNYFTLLEDSRHHGTLATIISADKISDLCATSRAKRCGEWHWPGAREAVQLAHRAVWCGSLNSRRYIARY